MATWTIPASEPDSKDSFKEQYYEVKKERDGIKQTLNELSNDNRQLRTKCAWLEKKKDINVAVTDQNAYSIGIGKQGVHQLQLDYDDLFKCYSGLQREYRAIVAKHKSAVQVINKQKREIQTLKLRCGPTNRNNRTNYAYRKQTPGGCRRKLSEVQHIKETPAANKENVDNVLLDQLQLRLGTAEEQLQTLKSNTKGEHEKSDGNNEVSLLNQTHDQYRG